MWWFRILLIFDVLALLVLAYFFVDGLRYADADYVGVWFPVLGVPVVAIGLASYLAGKGKRALATGLLAVLAIPPFLYLLFVALLLIMAPDFR